MAQITGSANVRQAAIDNAPALTETAVEFVKRQSAFVHKVRIKGFGVEGSL